MVSISTETRAETDARLRRVIRFARMEFLPGSYRFVEEPIAQRPLTLRNDALAAVRDDAVWSQLIPCSDQSEDSFAVFRFHFPEDLDNSGFVGWLASHLKHLFGTGVFVVCGQNSRDGGIFDYWGVPLELAAAVRDELAALNSG